jgi:hypothetical protein
MDLIALFVAGIVFGNLIAIATNTAIDLMFDDD